MYIDDMYGKGVFRAELQPAEVDPRFKIWARQIAVSRIFCPKCMKLMRYFFYKTNIPSQNFCLKHVPIS